MFKELLKEKFPDINGNIQIRKESNIFFISGEVFTSVSSNEIEQFLTDYITSKAPGSLIMLNIKVNNGLTIISEKVEDADTTRELDEVKKIFEGDIDINLLKCDNSFKYGGHPKYAEIRNIIDTVGFVYPIVVSQDLEVIDGHVRLMAMKELGYSKVPVIIINDNNIRKDFLKLALNRTSEFQRWDYEKVDNFVDNQLQCQPLLEPIGFFGKSVLPVSFFANTLMAYEIDPYNEQQRKYRQEEGLAAWAEAQRKRIKDETEAKNKKKTRKPGQISLFDKIYSNDDTIECYDISEEIDAFNKKWREKADMNTKLYDDDTAEAKKAAGTWQVKQRSSKQKAADLRAQAERENNNITEEEDNIE